MEDQISHTEPNLGYLHVTQLGSEFYQVQAYLETLSQTGTIVGDSTAFSIPYMRLRFVKLTGDVFEFIIAADLQIPTKWIGGIWGDATRKSLLDLVVRFWVLKPLGSGNSNNFTNALLVYVLSYLIANKTRGQYTQDLMVILPLLTFPQSSPKPTNWNLVYDSASALTNVLSLV